MKLPHNIEKHPCEPGYLGYDASGYAWRIQKSNSSYGNWCATSKHCPHVFVYAWRLAGMGQKLAMKSTLRKGCTIQYFEGME